MGNFSESEKRKADTGKLSINDAKQMTSSVTLKLQNLPAGGEL